MADQSRFLDPKNGYDNMLHEIYDVVIEFVDEAVQDRSVSEVEKLVNVFMESLSNDVGSSEVVKKMLTDTGRTEEFKSDLVDMICVGLVITC